jgi:transcriptional regulator with XRE-family HTH domain
MKDAPPPGLNERIARRLRDLRAAHAWSLETLGERSGVSRSMISLIERGESSPTAVVLERLATALGVPLASLFDAPQPLPEPVLRRPDQRTWRDPQSGYERRNLSPPGLASPIQLVEVSFPPGARVAYDTGPRDRRIDQQVWMLDGTMEITSGESRHRLGAGDCLAMVVDGPVSFRNPGRRAARYLVALVARAAPVPAG